MENSKVNYKYRVFNSNLINIKSYSMIDFLFNSNKLYFLNYLKGKRVKYKLFLMWFFLKKKEHNLFGDFIFSKKDYDIFINYSNGRLKSVIKYSKTQKGNILLNKEIESLKIANSVTGIVGVTDEIIAINFPYLNRNKPTVAIGNGFDVDSCRDIFKISEEEDFIHHSEDHRFFSEWKIIRYARHFQAEIRYFFNTNH